MGYARNMYGDWWGTHATYTVTDGVHMLHVRWPMGYTRHMYGDRWGTHATCTVTYGVHTLHVRWPMGYTCYIYGDRWGTHATCMVTDGVRTLHVRKRMGYTRFYMYGDRWGTHATCRPTLTDSLRTKLFYSFTCLGLHNKCKHYCSFKLETTATFDYQPNDSLAFFNPGIPFDAGAWGSIDIYNDAKHLITRLKYVSVVPERLENSDRKISGKVIKILARLYCLSSYFNISPIEIKRCHLVAVTFYFFYHPLIHCESYKIVHKSNYLIFFIKNGMVLLKIWYSWFQESIK